MRKETNMKSHAQKRLRLENLEERQLLTAAGLIDVPYGPEPAPVVCEASVVEESPAINLAAVDSNVKAGAVLGTTGTSLYVVELGDDPGVSGTLRDVLANAQPGDTIEFRSDIFTGGETITLTQGELTIDKAVTINASNLEGGITISGNDNSRIMSVSADAEVNLNGLTLTQGSCTEYSTTGSNSGKGGAIYNKGTLTVTNVNFTDNYANQNGGAIFNAEGATLTVDGGTISGNEASRNGGAFTNYGEMTISGTTKIENNQALYYGGAYFGYGDLYVTGNADFTGNKVTSEDSSKLGRGGAIYSGYSPDETKGGLVEITGSAKFSGNSAIDYGGAVVSYATLNITPGSNSEVVFENNNGGQYGGAIDVADTCEATLSGKVTLKTNTATERGGAIYSSGSLTFGYGEYNFEGNKAAYGGAITNDGKSDLTLTNVTFTKNIATKNGGAVFNTDNATLTVNGGTFSENTAGTNGGAVVNYGAMTISGTTTFKSNKAARYGGAYFGCGTLEITGDVTFNGNKVNDEGSRGGAIYNDVRDVDGLQYKEGAVTITGSATFKNNSARERAGAIMTYSKLNITPDKGETVDFYDNNGGEYGGAIDVGEDGEATLGGELTFGSNSAKYGGAIFSVDALTFKAGGDYTFTDNSAKAGGAIDACGGSLNLAGKFTFKANSVWRIGGGIAIAATTTLDDNNVNDDDNVKFVWSNNTAARGNCVAIDTDIADIAPEKFGLSEDPGADYTTFTVKRLDSQNEGTAITPEILDADAVAATITVNGASTTFGAEGVTPKALGLEVGTYEAFVQYTNADGEKSATYSLVLTVESDASSFDVRETSVANGRGVKFDFDLTSANVAGVSVWEISWGDGTTTRSENFSKSWMAAHYYAQDGVYDVSLKVTYLNGTSETFEAFATQTIGTAPLATTAQANILDVVLTDSDELFDEIDNLIPCGPAFSR